MSTELATLAQPRLPWHPVIEDRFGVDKASWKALVEAVFPSAKSANAVALALSYCKARGLDPFKKMVHIVPVWSTEKGSYVETVWPGIAEHRATACRTGQFGGCDECKFGPTIKRDFTDRVKSNGGGWEDKTIPVSFPEWAQLTVYRVVNGQRMPVPGPRVVWEETYSRSGKSVLPNERWAKAPFQMIEKCAEAAALRRAFPEELGGSNTDDEAGAIDRPGDGAVDVTPPAPPRPQREAEPAEMAAGVIREPGTAGDDIDAETGEVLPSGDAVLDVLNETTEPDRARGLDAEAGAGAADGDRPPPVDQAAAPVAHSKDSLRAEPKSPPQEIPRPMIGKVVDWPAYSMAIQQALIDADSIADIEAIRAANRTGLNLMFKGSRPNYEAVVETAKGRKEQLAVKDGSIMQ